MHRYSGCIVTPPHIRDSSCCSLQLLWWHNLWLDCENRHKTVFPLHWDIATVVSLFQYQCQYQNELPIPSKMFVSVSVSTPVCAPIRYQVIAAKQYSSYFTISSVSSDWCYISEIYFSSPLYSTQEVVLCCLGRLLYLRARKKNRDSRRSWQNVCIQQIFHTGNSKEMRKELFPLHWCHISTWYWPLCKSGCWNRFQEGKNVIEHL